MRLTIALCLSLLIVGCTTTGTRTPTPDGQEQIRCVSGPGGGSVRWPDGAGCSNGSWVDHLVVGVRATKSTADFNRNVSLTP